MKTATFKDWTLTKLDNEFGLSQIVEDEFESLKDWQNKSKSIEISDFEKQNLLNLQKPLQWGGRAWNEFELENKFISPVMMTANIDDRVIGYFLERFLKHQIGDYELSGIVDGMIAKGFRDPQIPFFCMHEYKRSVDNQGTPDAQVLASMLVVRELNANKKPVYGMFIVGLTWNFMVLKGNEYAISKDYKSDDDELFSIFQMIKALKEIIKMELL